MKQSDTNLTKYVQNTPAENYTILVKEIKHSLIEKWGDNLYSFIGRFNSVRGHWVTGWNAGCGKIFNCISNVRHSLGEGGKGKEAYLSNYGNEWSL